jgi:hypothetical protein
VWASAVERAPADQEAATTAPERPRAAVITAKGTESLVHLVNAQLAIIGAEFVTEMAKPTGPFSAVVFGAIDGHRVRLDFSTEPATGMCVVALVSERKLYPTAAQLPPSIELSKHTPGMQLSTFSASLTPTNKRYCFRSGLRSIFARRRTASAATAVER